MKISKVVTLFATGIIALSLLVTPTLADTLQFDFESYGLGNINGQDGWTKTGPYDVEVVNNPYGYTSFGTKSLRVSNGVASGSFGDQTFTKSLVNEAGETNAQPSSYSGGTRQNYFEAQFDFVSTMSTYQTDLLNSISPDRGDGARMSYVGLKDTVDGIDVIFYDYQDTAPFGNLVTPSNGCGAEDGWVLYNLGTYSRTTPHTLKLTMELIDGPRNDVVKVFVDNVLVHTGTSWEDYFRWCTESGGGVPNDATADVSRTVDSLLIMARGSSVSGNSGNGYLLDNFNLLSSTKIYSPPTNSDQCKKNGWMQFANPEFKNQGQCVSYVQKMGWKVTGDIYMSSPSQRFVFNASNSGKGTVEYWNYDFPGGLNYTAEVMCANIDKTNKEALVLFQIPEGYPGLSGLYILVSVKDGGTPGTNGDLFGFAVAPDLVTATSWCQTGTGFTPSMYTITGGDLVVHK